METQESVIDNLVWVQEINLEKQPAATPGLATLVGWALFTAVGTVFLILGRWFGMALEDLFPFWVLVLIICSLALAYCLILLYKGEHV